MSQFNYGGVDALISAPPPQVVVPVTTQNVTVRSSHVVLIPAGTLAALTLTLPTNPDDGTIIRVFSTQILTALTLTAGTGDTVTNGPTTVATAGTGFALIYDQGITLTSPSGATRTWRPIA